MQPMARRLASVLAAFVVGLFVVVSPLRAEPEGEEVDVALVLAVDISYSMAVSYTHLSPKSGGCGRSLP